MHIWARLLTRKGASGQVQSSPAGGQLGRPAAALRLLRCALRLARPEDRLRLLQTSLLLAFFRARFICAGLLFQLRMDCTARALSLPLPTPTMTNFCLRFKLDSESLVEIALLDSFVGKLKGASAGKLP